MYESHAYDLFSSVCHVDCVSEKVLPWRPLLKLCSNIMFVLLGRLLPFLTREYMSSGSEWAGAFLYCIYITSFPVLPCMASVFDHFQSAETEREGLGGLIMLIMSDRQMRGSAWYFTIYCVASSLLNNELYWQCLSNVSLSRSCKRYYKQVFFGHRPPSAYHYITSLLAVHVNKSTRPSPFCFCKLEAIKNG